MIEFVLQIRVVENQPKLVSELKQEELTIGEVGLAIYEVERLKKKLLAIEFELENEWEEEL